MADSNRRLLRFELKSQICLKNKSNQHAHAQCLRCFFFFWMISISIRPHHFHSLRKHHKKFHIHVLQIPLAFYPVEAETSLFS